MDAKTTTQGTEAPKCLDCGRVIERPELYRVCNLCLIGPESDDPGSDAMYVLQGPDGGFLRVGDIQARVGSIEDSELVPVHDVRLAAQWLTAWQLAKHQPERIAAGWKIVPVPCDDDRLEACGFDPKGYCDLGHHWVPAETLATVGPRFYEFDACADCRGEGD